MIEITVRTLDSQSHQFSVEDELTVLQFKQHIASTVNIAAETQRIIYAGRVLIDEAKLNELGVDGKVVHLVERPPPSDSQSNNDQPNRPPASALPQLQQQHRVLGGNAMYLGSMAIPFEAQNLVPPPPTFRLAASRLAVARRMLRRAEITIAWLENPSCPRTASTQSDNVQVEVTPVFEARVFVPPSSSDNIDENMMNAVHSSLLNNAANTPVTTLVDQATETTPPEGSAEPEGAQSADSTPDAATTPLSTSVEDLAGSAGTANQGTSTTGQENVSRTAEMADLLETLTRLQTRFAPFLERYQTFMRDDPVVDPGNVRATDRMFNRVSEVLHYFSHAYHSLSDMILRVRLPPPRRLVCRPILIQQTAVVPAGFPIQVEAQINFSSEVPMPNSTTSATQTAGENVRSTANTATSTHPTGMFAPGAVHVQSIPIGIRTMRSSSASRAGTANGNQSASTQNATANASNAAPNANSQQGGDNMNNQNVEFFMEVTPESITIDSMDPTPLLLAHQGDGAQGTNIPQPTPEFIQSIMQMAGQLVNRGASTSNITVNQRPVPNDATSSSGGSQPNAQGTAPGQNGVPGQNSQARGNTQTHPTTATHTRSTARPHVHFSQHAIQGFDPFLPCNSHHIMHLRHPRSRTPSNNNQNQPNNNNVRPPTGDGPTNPANPMNPVLNLVQGLLGSLQNMYGRRGAAPTADVQAPQPSTPASSADGGQPVPAGDAEQSFQNMFQGTLFSEMPQFMMQQNVDSTEPISRATSIVQLVQELGGQITGDGVLTELLMLLSQHWTIADLLQLNTGRLDPLVRIRNEIYKFFADRVLEGNAPNPANVERGVNKLISELQPFLDCLSQLPVRNDIDIVRSAQVLLRNRLTKIIKFVAMLRSASLRSQCLNGVVEQLKQLGRHLCALITHASSNGRSSVDDVFNRMTESYMAGIAPEMQQVLLTGMRTRLHKFIAAFPLPASALQSYLVKNLNRVIAETEPMDVDGEQAATEEEAVSNVLGVIDLDDSEDVPEVVIGSESWHGQVPPDWVPIIASDTQRQRRQSPAPLSDAYLSGMPNKRRKVVTNNKPQGTLPQVITEGIRRAVTTTGNAPAANLDAVAAEAGSNLTIQSAYRDLLRTSVQTRIQDNEDFTPERFPNATSYFKKSNK